LARQVSIAIGASENDKIRGMEAGNVANEGNNNSKGLKDLGRKISDFRGTLAKRRNERGKGGVVSVTVYGEKTKKKRENLTATGGDEKKRRKLGRNRMAPQLRKTINYKATVEKKEQKGGGLESTNSREKKKKSPLLRQKK